MHEQIIIYVPSTYSQQRMHLMEANILFAAAYEVLGKVAAVCGEII